MSRQVSTTYRSQRELLADVAHELRTPLTSVQGYARALKDGVIEEAPGREKALTIISREAERMSNLIGQLLELARFESGQTKIAIQPVAVAYLVERVAERFRPLAVEKGIVFSASSPGGMSLLGDEHRLVQVFSNLVANAIEHTPAGGLVSINASLVAAIWNGDPGVRIIVHDTGHGIAAERLPRVFDRFERGERDADSSTSGFGLGLAIVRELIDLHHGSITAHSEGGRGSTFTVDLPSPQ